MTTETLDIPGRIDPIDERLFGAVVDEPLDARLDEILPTAARQRELVAGVQSDDPELVGEFINTHEIIVAAVVHPFKGLGVESDDLLHIGFTTLHSAAQNFSLNSEEDFFDHAVNEIRAALGSALTPETSIDTSPQPHSMEGVLRYMVTLDNDYERPAPKPSPKSAEIPDDTTIQPRDYKKEWMTEAKKLVRWEKQETRSVERGRRNLERAQERKAHREANRQIFTPNQNKVAPMLLKSARSIAEDTGLTQKEVEGAIERYMEQLGVDTKTGVAVELHRRKIVTYDIHIPDEPLKDLLDEQKLRIALAIASASNPQIAQAEGLTPATMMGQMKKIKERLGVTGRTEVAIIVDVMSRRDQEAAMQADTI